jgi:carboxymethylenebutenolidase
MDNVEIHIYPGTDHAFFNDTHGPDCYDEANARLAWDRTIDFLGRHLV